LIPVWLLRYVPTERPEIIGKFQEFDMQVPVVLEHYIYMSNMPKFYTFSSILKAAFNYMIGQTTFNDMICTFFIIIRGLCI